MLKQIKDKNFIPNLLWPLVVILLASFLLGPLFASDFHLESRHPCKIKRDSDVFVNTIKSLKNSNFKKAIELGLSMDMDLAVAKLNLAGVAMSRRRKLEATNLLNEAKKLDKQGMLKEQITMMKEQMKKI